MALLKKETKMIGKNGMNKARHSGFEESAANRLDAVLEDSYASLSGRFTASEMVRLIDKIGDWVLDIDDTSELDDIAYDFEMEPTGRKLMRLSLVQKHALVDLMARSRFRNPGKSEDLGLFAELGVKFKTEAVRESNGRFAATACAATH